MSWERGCRADLPRARRRGVEAGLGFFERETILDHGVADGCEATLGGVGAGQRAGRNRGLQKVLHGCLAFIDRLAMGIGECGEGLILILIRLRPAGEGGFLSDGQRLVVVDDFLAPGTPIGRFRVDSLCECGQ